jgi:hypothetical protein
MIAAAFRPAGIDMASKTKILFLAANARDTSHLRLGEEIRSIDERIRSSAKANSFELISQWAVRPSDVMQALMRYRPAILHFSGHATQNDEILLEDDDGKSKPVAVAELLTMFSAFNKSIRLVVLNACYSNAGLENSSQAIDYVVGSTAVLGDKAALAFAGSFYQALGFGRSVQDAFELAKCDVSLQGFKDAEIFNLLIREGVDASEPFLSGRAKRTKRSTVPNEPIPVANALHDGNVVSTLDQVPTVQADINSIRENVASGLLAIGEYSQGIAVTRSSSVPVEIQESFQRFQMDYPDPTKVAFLMMRFGRTQAHDQIVAGIKRTLDPLGIAVVRADDKEYHDDLFSNVLTYAHGSGFGIAVFERIETEEFNPNVALEVGYMYALRKPLCLLKDKTLNTLQADLVGKLYRVFDPLDPIGTIPKELSRWLKHKGLDKPR